MRGRSSLNLTLCEHPIGAKRELDARRMNNKQTALAFHGQELLLGLKMELLEADNGMDGWRRSWSLLW